MITDYNDSISGLPHSVVINCMNFLRFYQSKHRFTKYSCWTINEFETTSCFHIFFFAFQNLPSYKKYKAVTQPEWNQKQNTCCCPVWAIMNLALVKYKANFDIILICKRWKESFKRTLRHRHFTTKKKVCQFWKLHELFRTSIKICLLKGIPEFSMNLGMLFASKRWIHINKRDATLLYL